MFLLNDIINEKIYVKQPPSFESDVFSNHVSKHKKVDQTRYRVYAYVHVFKLILDNHISQQLNISSDIINAIMMPIVLEIEFREKGPIEDSPRQKQNIYQLHIAALNFSRSSINLRTMPFFKSYLSKNPILHYRAKHIEIKHHFIRDYIQKGILDMKFTSIDEQLADIFTKLFLKIISFISEIFS
ncbi:Copia protein, partial [Mucuna pruriens]